MIPRTLRRFTVISIAFGERGSPVAASLGTLQRFAIFMPFLLQESKVTADPTQALVLPRQWKTLPKYLSMEQIDALLEAPDETKPNGLRDRAMLQFLYATGLRVYRICTVEYGGLNLNMGMVRVLGKGRKERLVPIGQCAVQAIEAYLERRRTSSARNSRYLFLDESWRPDDTSRFLEVVEKLRETGRSMAESDTPCAPAQLCHPSARAGSRPSKPSNNARPR